MRSAPSGELEPPFLDLHAATWTAPERYEIRPDARRLENCETSYAGKIGLGVAVGYALDWGITAIETRVTALADDLRTRQLADLVRASVHYDNDDDRARLLDAPPTGPTRRLTQPLRFAASGAGEHARPCGRARLDCAAALLFGGAR